jgi:hypothetical protein
MYTKKTAMALAIAAAFSPPTQAANLYWACGNNWWDATCWSSTSGGSATLGQPKNGDNVYLTQSDATNRTVSFWNLAYPYAVLNSLRINATGSGEMTLSQNLHQLSANNEDIGNYGHGVFNQSGGTNTVGYQLSLGGGDSSSNGTYNLSGTGSLSAGSEFIGRAGAGTFNQSSGTTNIVTSSLYIGYLNGSQGAYNLNGGSLTANDEHVSSGGGPGYFIQNGGTNTVSNALSISSNSYYDMNGGSLTASKETIGEWGNGDFSQNGGIHTVSNSLTLGLNSGSLGTFKLNSGKLDVGGNILIGLGAANITLYGGTLNVGGNIVGGNGVTTISISGGALNVTGNTISVNYFNVGNSALLNGSFTLGNRTTLTTQFETIGQYSTGTFTQNGGSNAVSDTLTLGNNVGSIGIYNLNGGSLTAYKQEIGVAGTGVFTQNGGENWVSNSLILGASTGGANTYNLNGGTLTVGGQEFIGEYWVGLNTFNQTGGTHTVGDLHLAVINGSEGNYNLSAGSLSASKEYIGDGGTGIFTQTGGTNTVMNSLTLGLANGSIGSYTLNDGVLNVGSLNKGAGSAIFNFNAGTLSFSTNLLLDTTSPLDSNLVLTGVKTLSVVGTTTLSGFNTLTLDGGTFSTGALANNGGFTFNKGTFGLTGANLTIGAGGLFGSSVQFNSNQTVKVRNTTTINSGSVLALNNSAFISGTTNNNGQLALGGVISNLGGGTLNNAGKITGTGQVSAPLNNMIGGEVRATSGNDMVFTNTNNTNSGRITVVDGSVDFTQGLTNASTGLISGRGIVATGSTAATGLINQGNIAVSGTTDFIGDVSNTGAGKIVISGGATATFHDDVIHNGSEIRVSSGSQAVFLGAVSGASAYTGTGTVFFEGDLRPGNSPALVTVGGDMALGAASNTTMELGGLLRGAQYDAMDIGGTLSLNGMLNVALYDLGSGSFMPHAGASFDLFTAETLQGKFSSLTYTALPAPNLSWHLDYLTDAVGTTDVVRLSVQAVPEPQTYAMMLAGLGLVGWASRRRKS